MKRIFILITLVFSIVLLAACNKKPTGPAKIEGKTTVDVRHGDPDFNILAGIKATDEARGDVTDKITVDGTVDVQTVGSYDVTFSIQGSDGTVDTLTVTFTVAKLQLQGAEYTEVGLGSFAFDPLAGLYVIDPVDGRITSANAVQAKIEFVIKKEGQAEPVEEVNTKSLDNYDIIYTISYKGSTNEIIRKVSVLDKVIWRGIGEATIEIGDTFVPEHNVSASQPEFTTDPETGDEIITSKSLTEFIRVFANTIDNQTPGEYEVTYKIEDPEKLGQDPVVYFKYKDEEVTAVRTVKVVNKVILLGAGNATINKGDAFDPMKGVTARDSLGALEANKISVTGTVDTTTVGEYELTYTVQGRFDVEVVVKRIIKVIEPTQGVTDIYFMSGDPTENDPFNPDFSGGFVTERQQLQRDVEERYNVKVRYVTYPANASWGPARISAMIEAEMGGNPLADVYYHISSDWIPQLVNGNAIGSVEDFLKPGAIGEDVPQKVKEAATYKKKAYGFSLSSLGIESGFYYNADIVARLGLPNPTDLYLDGGWNWTTFKNWALQAKAALSAEEYVIGGVIAEYAENLVPLNGGDFIDDARGRVVFDRQEALDTYAFIKELYDAELWEPSPEYDDGSVEWKTGKVIFHPGHFWFIKADNRWGGVLNFELGFVPFPMSEAYIAAGGEYRSPIYGPSFPVMANGISDSRKELVFKVWRDLQRRPDPERAAEEYRELLEGRFNKDNYIDAYISVSDKAYRSLLYGIGIGGYSSGSFRLNINLGIREGTYDTLLRQIKPAYTDALNRYLAD